MDMVLSAPSLSCQSSSLYPLYGAGTSGGWRHWLICNTLMKSRGWIPRMPEGRVTPMILLVRFVA
uniref:Uncharacterized protein n=1 Tax=Rhizophora mucronata TaxID=61149 RepID=A0A2P2NZ50_RHIMU